MFQEDLYIFFENMSKELRDLNIPIFNRYGTYPNFPKLISKDDIMEYGESSDEEITDYKSD